MCLVFQLDLIFLTQLDHFLYRERHHNVEKLFRESNQKTGFKSKASTFGENFLVLIERKTDVGTVCGQDKGARYSCPFLCRSHQMGEWRCVW